MAGGDGRNDERISRPDLGAADPASRPRDKSEQASERRRRGSEGGESEPLPGVEDSGEELRVGDRAVEDWSARHGPSRRFWRKSISIGIGLTVAGIAAVAALRVAKGYFSEPGHAAALWTWAERISWIVAIIGVSLAGLVSWFASLVRGRDRRGVRRSLRREQVMLKKIQVRAVEISGHAHTGHYISPTFMILGPAKRGNKHRQSYRSVPRQRFDSGGIRELYEYAGEELVLLGNAGMGKSTQLAELARVLVTEALDELTKRSGEGQGLAPIPLLVGLATYRGQEFEDWLVAETHRSYDGVPKTLIRAWLDDDRVLPILDGLDTVPQQHRRECAKQINRYRRRCTGIVVSCRDRDHQLAHTIGAAIYAELAPPSRPEVQRYLQACGGSGALSDVRAALASDSGLWGLLQSPLMLNVIHHTYMDRPASELHQPGSPELRRSRIFDAYIGRMLERPSRYSAAATVRWLSWLARMLDKHGEEVFYLDRLSESWVHKEDLKFTRSLPRTVYVNGVVLLALGWLALARFVGGGHFNFVSAIPYVIAVLGISVFTLVVSRGPARPWDSGKLGVMAVPALSVSAASYSGTSHVLVGIVFIWAVITSLSQLTLAGLDPVEQLRWSWKIRLRAGIPGRSAGKYHAFFEMIGGILIGICMASAFRLFGIGPISATVVVESCVVVLVLSLLEGFEPDLRKTRSRPNEGIRRSARYAMVQGTVYLLATVALMGPLLTLTSDGDLYAMRMWLVALLLGGLFGAAQAYRYGGLACLHHWAIRSVLSARRRIPLRYEHFLRDAEQRILVRRVGSGFAFPHRLLQEHLAAKREEDAFPVREAN
ncbi:hypothetical protein GCM10023196_024300 [Actinoallomurus vinaceus]|uniref:NACHT domain-containing protein n=1 Tax=Actinoallomurus vinaceus TaxID=1080074 RepID=A0ABP8U7K4_9ACTN